MTSQAKAGQIILRPTRSAGVHRSGAQFASRGRHHRCVLNEEMELYEVLWQQEDATSMLPSIAMGGMHGARRIRVRYLDREIVLDDTRNEITMGRAEENSVVQKGTLISRLHARIELVRGRFLLVDQSTNGTFVLNADGRSRSCVGTPSRCRARVHRTRETAGPNAADVIRFALEE